MLDRAEQLGDPEYPDRIIKAAVAEHDGRITFDAKHPAWIAEKRRNQSGKKRRRPHAKYRAVVDWMAGLKAIGYGAAEIAKNKIGRGMAPALIAQHRMEVCNECELAVPCAGKKGETLCCGGLGAAFDSRKPGCGCIIANKVRRATEACPHPDGPKWPSVPVIPLDKEPNDA